MQYDVFVSYARQDDAGGRISEFVERIQADFAAFAGRPLKPFFDRSAIHGMEDWRHRILQGLRESRLLLACLSPAYLKSDYCRWEFTEYLKHEVARLCVGEGVATIYFVPVPGWDAKEFEAQCDDWIAELRRRQHFDLRPWYDEGEAALREAAVQEQMAGLQEQLADRIRRGERAEQALGNVDAPNPHFIGRVEDVRRLRESLSLGRVGVLTAVHGLGGMGKTALAIEYAHAFAHEYGGGRWQVRCEGKDDLRAAVATLAGVRDLPIEFTDEERLSLDLQFERVLRELKRLAEAREPHRCLLILDNVDRPELLSSAQTQRLPPADWLHVIATTRLGEGDLFGQRPDRAFLPVDELPEEEALALLEAHQPGGRFASDEEWHAAREIMRLLGGFTLAVEAAAVYLGHFAGDVTCAGFLQRLQKEGVQGLDAAAAQSGGGALHDELRLSATLRPTLERLGERETLALQYAALLPPDHVPLPWLRVLVAKHVPEVGQDAEPGYPDPWRDLLRRLFSLRLLQGTGVADPEGKPLLARMHRLLQDLVRRGPSPDALAARQQAVDALVRERDAALEKTTRWTEARWELELLDALAILWAEREHPRAAWLCNQVGQRWYALAEWSRAEPLMRRALAIDEDTYGPDHPHVGIRLNNLGQLLKATNRAGEAEALMRRALEVREQRFGPDHPNVVVPLNNLAELLQATNRLDEAEPLLRRALEIGEASSGPDHPSVATALNNLARLLHDTSRLAEAELLMRRALAIDEQAYGPHHPHVATDLSNLALLLKGTNRLGEAEALMRRALAIDEQSYGLRHPHVARDLSNLAQLLQDTNRLAEAEPLMRRALEIDEASYGPDHPDVASDLNNLAWLLKATNRLDEAEPLLRRALEIGEASSGPDHPSVAVALNNLALLLKATNRLAEAEPLMRRALEILLNFTQSTGYHHPKLRLFTKNYAALLRAMGQSEADIRTHLDALGQPYGFGDGRLAALLD